MTRGNVLVVEDDDAIRHLLMEYLRERAGVSVDGARDGVDALHHISSKTYAVVILDVMMPLMSGVDFLDSLQALLSDPSVKSLDEPPAVVVVTSLPAEEVPSSRIVERFPSLVRAVLRKPVDAHTLASEVEALL